MGMAKEVRLLTKEEIDRRMASPEEARDLAWEQRRVERYLRAVDRANEKLHRLYGEKAGCILYASIPDADYRSGALFVDDDGKTRFTFVSDIPELACAVALLWYEMNLVEFLHGDDDSP